MVVEERVDDIPVDEISCSTLEDQVLRRLRGRGLVPPSITPDGISEAGT